MALQAVQSLSTPEFVSPRAAAWLVRTRALRSLNKESESSRETEAFSTWAASTGDAGAVLLAHVARAEQLWSRDERKAAMEHYEAALAQSSIGRPPEDAVAVVLSYGNALIESNDLDRAAAVVGRLAAHVDTDFDCALLMVKLYRALKQPVAWRAALQTAISLSGERSVPQSLTEMPHPCTFAVSQEPYRHK